MIRGGCPRRMRSSEGGRESCQIPPLGSPLPVVSSQAAKPSRPLTDLPSYHPLILYSTTCCPYSEQRQFPVLETIFDTVTPTNHVLGLSGSGPCTLIHHPSFRIIHSQDCGHGSSTTWVPEFAADGAFDWQAWSLGWNIIDIVFGSLGILSKAARCLFVNDLRDGKAPSG